MSTRRGRSDEPVRRRTSHQQPSERPMTVQRVFIPDPIHADGVAALRRHFDVYSAPNGDAQARRQAFQQADAVVVRNSAVDARLLDASPKLKVISKHGAGVDNIDIKRATDHGIVVANVPGANAGSVAEATVALMLATLRRVPEIHELVKDGRYGARFELQFEQLSGRTLGLVGIGNIGARVARMCGRGFDMRVLAYDPGLSAAEVAERGASKVDDLDRLLAEADVVSLHLPLTADTFHILDRKRLEQMKPTAIVVNAARGALIDEPALAEALHAGVIAGAGLDVLETEPPLLDGPILSAPNVVLSPHTAGNSVEAARRLAVSSAEIVIAALTGQKPPGLLNPEVWEARRR